PHEVAEWLNLVGVLVGQRRGPLQNRLGIECGLRHVRASRCAASKSLSLRLQACSATAVRPTIRSAAIKINARITQNVRERLCRVRTPSATLGSEMNGTTCGRQTVITGGHISRTYC